MSGPFVERHAVAIALAFGLLLTLIGAVAIMIDGNLSHHAFGTGAL
jgi:hypothetical protein